MSAARCLALCFSPTGTTRVIAEAVASGTGISLKLHDITPKAARQNAVELLPDDLVLLAAPVYYGRVQKHAAEYFSGLNGQGQPAVLLVNYGNRHYDDALLELHNLAQEVGLRPIAAAAFVSEHSFSTPEHPMAQGRPDTRDLAQAAAFGRSLLKNLQPVVRQLAAVPGNKPYKPYPDFHRAPVTSEACTLCGVCEALCPTGAIFMDMEKAATREEDCIVCQACVKKCPEGARADTAPGAKETREHLRPLVAERKDSAVFL